MAHLFPLLQSIPCIVFLQHDQESRLHKEHALDGVVHLEGKKGFSEDEFNGRRIVSAKQMEHLKKAANAEIYGKHEEPRLERSRIRNFQPERSNQKVIFWLNQQPDQR